MLLLNLIKLEINLAVITSFISLNNLIYFTSIIKKLCIIFGFNLSLFLIICLFVFILIF